MLAYMECQFNQLKKASMVDALAILKNITWRNHKQLEELYYRSLYFIPTVMSITKSKSNTLPSTGHELQHD